MWLVADQHLEKGKLLTSHHIFDLQWDTVERIVGVTEEMRANCGAVDGDPRAGKDDRVIHEGGVLHIGDKRVTRSGGHLFVDGQRVEE